MLSAMVSITSRNGCFGKGWEHVQQGLELPRNICGCLINRSMVLKSVPLFSRKKTLSREMDFAWKCHQSKGLKKGSVPETAPAPIL